MYLDTKREGELQTEADPFSLESLIAWLEKQPASKEYNYCEFSECLAAQYFDAMNLGSVYRSHHGGLNALIPGLWNVAQNRNLPIGDLTPFGRGWTFGAALKRARALQTK